MATVSKSFGQTSYENEGALMAESLINGWHCDIEVRGGFDVVQPYEGSMADLLLSYQISSFYGKSLNATGSQLLRSEPKFGMTEAIHLILPHPQVCKQNPDVDSVGSLENNIKAFEPFQDVHSAYIMRADRSTTVFVLLKTAHCSTVLLERLIEVEDGIRGRLPDESFSLEFIPAIPAEVSELVPMGSVRIF